MSGARSLRSEVVAALKTHALTIFEITDIPADKFFDEDARDQSAQLEALRHSNTFLYAKEETVPGDNMARYLRSECIARVSLHVYPQNSVIDNRFIGTPSHFAWSQSHFQKRQQNPDEFTVPEVWYCCNYGKHDKFCGDCRMSFKIGQLLFILTERKLFFLLSDSTTFSEDDDRFRSFFEMRLGSLDDLQERLPDVYGETLTWLRDEVLTRPRLLKTKTAMQIEQDEFEEQYARDFEEAVAQSSTSRR